MILLYVIIILLLLVFTVGCMISNRLRQFLLKNSKYFTLTYTLILILGFIVINSTPNELFQKNLSKHVVMYLNLLLVVIIWLVTFVVQNKVRIESDIEYFEKLKEHFPFNPIITTKSTFKKVISNLLKIKTKELALEFAIDSLNEISKTAFVKMDVSLSDYTQKLETLVKGSDRRIIGTYTFRPEELYTEIKNIQDVKMQTNDIKELIEYINIFNAKSLIQDDKIRIVVFEPQVLKAILNDAINQMEKDLEDNSDRIPEIGWFVEKISKGAKLKWTSTEFFLKCFSNNGNIILPEDIKKIINPAENCITDFAIFDDEILITWRENHPSIKSKSSDIDKDKGTLLMSWTDNVPEISKLLEDIVKQQNNKYYLFDTFEQFLDFIKTNNLGYKYEEIKTLYEQLLAKMGDGYGWNKNQYQLLNDNIIK
ncbi:hypothetical protein H8E88_05330 [candidate division KSB1 bacterium]|nr:hypothetical protein [candidate division KSB1 bacterium]